MHPAIQRLRPAAISLALLAGAVAVALVVAELAVRLILPQQLILVRPDIWQAVDTLGWAKRPNLETTINTGERTVALATDSLGLRVPGGGRSPATGVPPCRILLLGDSFMEALQVNYEQSLAGLLESRASAALDRPVEVWNAGVAGWGPSQYLLAARALFARAAIDYVLVALYVGNDAELLRRDYVPPRSPTVVHRLRVPRGLSWRAWRDAVFYPVNDMLERRSHLFILFKTATEQLRARFGVGGPDFPYEIRRREAASPRWEVTATIAEDIARLAQEHGAGAGFVLIPSAYQVDTLVFQSFARTFRLDPTEVDLEQPNHLLREALRARGLPVTDGLPAMRAAHTRGVGLFGAVDEHLTPEGHDVLAGLVLDTIIQQLGRVRRQP